VVGTEVQEAPSCLAGSAPPLVVAPPTSQDQTTSQLPDWWTRPKDRLAQFIKYCCTYDLFGQLSRVEDGRERPQIPTADVVLALFFTAVLRLPSLNALEGELKKAGFQHLLGRRGEQGKKAFSADTVARSLDGLNLEQLRKILHDVVHRAERNKAFRDGPVGARRPVALDGWESFSSYHRHCGECLQRKIKFKNPDREVIQYYHSFVVPLLLAGDAELVLDIEPLRTADMRRQDGETADTHDGEQTAAMRLVDHLHAEFGSLIDLNVLDALYPNGPMMTRVTERGYGAIMTLKKETDEPLKDALLLMAGRPPDVVWDDAIKKEHLVAWDVDDIETLDTFEGKVRVLRAEVSSLSKPMQPTRTWCTGVIGDRARHLSPQIVHDLHRRRWHIENTIFNQWTQHWHLNHVYRHTPNAVVAVMLLWCLAFNMMQLFAYRRLRRPRVPKDPCDTIKDLVSLMKNAVSALQNPMPWTLLHDT